MTTIGKTHIEVYEKCRKDYPTLDRVANVLSKSRSDIIGRDGNDIRKGLSNPEKANVLILGDPGTGKTASVRGFAYSPDTLATSIVLEVNPELLITQGEDKESAMLVGFRRLVEEAGKYSKDHDVITILFIDEFHKIVMYAPSAIEALKPILEKSAANYFRIIASTTFKEYSDNMAGNRAFDQRFLRLTLPELSKDAVLHILTNTAFHWGLEKLTSPTIMEEIYVESKSLLISNAQPRASLDILQAMVAEITKTIWVENGVEKRSYYTPQELGIADEYSISRPILKRAIKRMYSVDIDRGVDVKEVIHALNTRLFNQEQAIATVTSQLEMAAHNFGELDRPKVSFLSTGSTGVGKTELAKIISETMSLPLKRFDMSRYASDDNATDFADDLFHAAWSTPNAYLLIDEVEKSSRKAMNILLQVLDDARLNDSTDSDRVASFSGNIINLTTNLGSEVYQNMSMHKDSTAVVDTELIYKALSDAEIFETAVLGRIDAIVPFRPLPFEALMKIAKRALQNMIDAAQTDTRHIIVSDDVVQYIVKDRTSTDSERGGARDVKRNVKNLVVQVLAHYLTYAKEELPVILYIEGRPRFKYKNVADPLNAHVALKECYSIAYVTDILKAISKQIGKPLVNRGLYLPNDADIKVYIEQIMRLASQGHNKFDSIMDGETCVIRGVV